MTPRSAHVAATKPCGNMMPPLGGFAKLGLFTFGLGIFLNVNIVGYVTVSELMAALILPVLWFRGMVVLRGPVISVLLNFGMLWVVSAVGTDLYRGNEWALMARGVGRVSAFILMLLVFYALFRRRQDGFQIMMFGAFISSIVSIFGFRAGESEFVLMTGYVMETSWERHYALVTVMFAFWLSTWLYPKKPMIVSVTLLGIGVLNMGMGSRNMGAIVLLAGLSSECFRWMKSSFGTRGIGMAFVARAALILAIAAGSVYGGYKVAAAQGWLGDAARDKFYAQSSGKLGVLFTSRVDFLAGLLAVRSSPFIGYGSWARDEQGFLAEAYAIGELGGAGTSTMYSYFQRIPTHSAVLEAWVENGLLATGFWLSVLWLMARVAGSGALLDSRWSLFFLLSIFWIGWNILFSPFASRGLYAASIAVMALYVEGRRFAR
ncbi:MAG: hypothetical protein QM691_01535 [Opitutaceae bacterium]